MTDFCHITPTAYIDQFAAGRKHHLVLAHLIEKDQQYTDHYAALAKDPQTTIICDNSAFEMVKAGRPMYPTEKLLDMASAVHADYIVMSDYPGEPSEKTIEAAIATAPIYKQAGFGTFFVPQAPKGEVEQLLNCFGWAAESHLVDYMALSILSAPYAFDVENNNKLQRFLSRWKLLNMMDDRGIVRRITRRNKKFHMLGMVDGPNEIQLVRDYLYMIDTWDSSAAVWAGLNDICFDNSPTGLINGKFEVEVDFNHTTATPDQITNALANINYIDTLLEDVTI